eukprot:GHVN01072529.1.p1 GENE.GHVN01072529.1~~GHVN01072529.1.p1  ORF type:complete len:1137 (-),score=153.13 GHVN01072529.1:2307-5717(-)
MRQVVLDIDFFRNPTRKSRALKRYQLEDDTSRPQTNRTGSFPSRREAPENNASVKNVAKLTDGVASPQSPVFGTDGSKFWSQKQEEVSCLKGIRQAAASHGQASGGFTSEECKRLAKEIKRLSRIRNAEKETLPAEPYLSVAKPTLHKKMGTPKGTGNHVNVLDMKKLFVQMKREDIKNKVTKVVREQRSLSPSPRNGSRQIGGSQQRIPFELLFPDIASLSHPLPPAFDANPSSVQSTLSLDPNYGVPLQSLDVVDSRSGRWPTPPPSNPPPPYPGVFPVGYVQAGTNCNSTPWEEKEQKAFGISSNLDFRETLASTGLPADSSSNVTQLTSSAPLESLTEASNAGTGTLVVDSPAPQKPGTATSIPVGALERAKQMGRPLQQRGDNEESIQQCAAKQQQPDRRTAEHNANSTLVEQQDMSPGDTTIDDQGNITGSRASREQRSDSLIRSPSPALAYTYAAVTGTAPISPSTNLFSNDRQLQFFLHQQRLGHLVKERTNVQDEGCDMGDLAAAVVAVSAFPDVGDQFGVVSVGSETGATMDLNSPLASSLSVEMDALRPRRSLTPLGRQVAVNIDIHVEDERTLWGPWMEQAALWTGLPCDDSDQDVPNGAFFPTGGDRGGFSFENRACYPQSSVGGVCDSLSFTPLHFQDSRSGLSEFDDTSRKNQDESLSSSFLTPSVPDDSPSGLSYWAISDESKRLYKPQPPTEPYVWGDVDERKSFVHMNGNRGRINKTTEWKSSRRVRPHQLIAERSPPSMRKRTEALHVSSSTGTMERSTTSEVYRYSSESLNFSRSIQSSRQGEMGAPQNRQSDCLPRDDETVRICGMGDELEILEVSGSTQGSLSYSNSHHSGVMRSPTHQQNGIGQAPINDAGLGEVCWEDNVIAVGSSRREQEADELRKELETGLPNGRLRSRGLSGPAYRTPLTRDADAGVLSVSATHRPLDQRREARVVDESGLVNQPSQSPHRGHQRDLIAGVVPVTRRGSTVRPGDRKDRSAGSTTRRPSSVGRGIRPQSMSPHGEGSDRALGKLRQCGLSVEKKPAGYNPVKAKVKAMAHIPPRVRVMACQKAGLEKRRQAVKQQQADLKEAKQNAKIRARQPPVDIQVEIFGGERVLGDGEAESSKEDNGLGVGLFKK